MPQPMVGSHWMLLKRQSVVYFQACFHGVQAGNKRQSSEGNLSSASNGQSKVAIGADNAGDAEESVKRNDGDDGVTVPLPSKRSCPLPPGINGSTANTSPSQTQPSTLYGGAS